MIDRVATLPNSLECAEVENNRNHSFKAERVGDESNKAFWATYVKSIKALAWVQNLLIMRYKMRKSKPIVQPFSVE